MAPACRGGAVTWMTAVVDAIDVCFSCFVIVVIVIALLAFWLDVFLFLYVLHQTVAGAGVKGKKKKKKEKKKEKKEKSRAVVVEALVEGEKAGVVGFVGEESMLDEDGGLVVKGGNVVQTECFDGGLVVEGGDLKQTECFDGNLVVKGGDLEQTECVDGRLVVEGGDSDGSLVVIGGDLEETECSNGSEGVGLEQMKWLGGCLVVEDGGLEQTECLDGRLVVEGGDLEQTECSDDSLVVNGGDLEQTECADGSLVVEGGDLTQTECCDCRLVVQDGQMEQTECSDGKDVVFGDGAADGGCGVEDGEGILPSQGEDDDDDDEWVGIEKSGLGERFGCLASFMASEAGEALLGTVGSDVWLRLYALHKVAVEGPCYKPPAFVLTSSARTKWNSWKSLGTMDPERAMEQYIMLLGENIPGLEEKISEVGQ